MNFEKLEKRAYRNGDATRRFVARQVINSVYYAELFIKKWKKESGGTRKEAIVQLEKLGVNLKRLKKKEARLAKEAMMAADAQQEVPMPL